MADTELEEKWGGGGESGGSSLTKANHLSQKLDPVSLMLEIWWGGEGRGFPWVPSLGLPLQVQETPIYGILVNDQQV